MIWISYPWKIALMLAPALILFTAFFVYPVGYAIAYSFTNSAGFGAAKFVGLDNYMALTSDPFFWQTAAQHRRHPRGQPCHLDPVVIRAGAASAPRVSRAAARLRALVFAPAIVAPILIGLIWVFILDPNVGLINGFLASLGIYRTAVDRRDKPDAALRRDGLHLADARVHPHDLLRRPAAAAPRRHRGQPTRRREQWQQLRYVTVPMLQETFGICTVLVITGCLQDLRAGLRVDRRWSGAPVRTLVSYMYYVTFQLQSYGYGHVASRWSSARSARSSRSAICCCAGEASAHERHVTEVQDSDLRASLRPSGSGPAARHRRNRRLAATRRVPGHVRDPAADAVDPVAVIPARATTILVHPFSRSTPLTRQLPHSGRHARPDADVQEHVHPGDGLRARRPVISFMASFALTRMVFRSASATAAILRFYLLAGSGGSGLHSAVSGLPARPRASGSSAPTAALILPYIATTIPFNTLLLTGFLRRLSRARSSRRPSSTASACSALCRVVLPTDATGDRDDCWCST